MNIQTLNGENYKILACSGANPSNDLFILPLSATADTGKEIQLLPFGKVKSKKGDMLVDDESIQAIIANFNKEKNDSVIDYEHQTLKDVEAPASGWIKELINKGPEGLWGVVEWTPKAKSYIENKEYRYISPVVLVRKSDRRPVMLHSAGLTNTPAIDGMEPIACKDKFGEPSPKEDNKMDLKKLAALLGLPETATEEEVLAALNARLQNSQVIANKGLLDLLGLSATASLDDAKGAIIALKNPSGYVKAEDFAALKKKLDEKDRDDLVDLALKAGKIAPASLDWAKEYALKDPAGFRAFVDKAPVVVPLEEIANKETPKHTVTDETQLSINKSLGISDEDYKKFGV